MMVLKRRAIYQAVTAACLTGLIPLVAQGQTGDESKKSAQGLEVIVVTAQKREQSIQTSTTGVSGD